MCVSRLTTFSDLNGKVLTPLPPHQHLLSRGSWGGVCTYIVQGISPSFSKTVLYFIID